MNYQRAIRTGVTDSESVYSKGGVTVKDIVGTVGRVFVVSTSIGALPGRFVPQLKR
jgi:hypothetical protein